LQLWNDALANIDTLMMTLFDLVWATAIHAPLSFSWRTSVTNTNCLNAAL